MATSGLDLVIVEGIVRILLMLRFFLINDILYDQHFQMSVDTADSSLIKLPHRLIMIAINAIIL